MLVSSSRLATRTAMLRRLSPTNNVSSSMRPADRVRQLLQMSQETETHPALRNADFLDIVDRHVQLGSSLRGAVVRAVDECGDTPDAIRVLLLHCRTGAPIDDRAVLDDANEKDPDDAFLIKAIVASSNGGPATSFALQRAAWSLRERHTIQRERRTHAAQAMFSARILSWLPVAFGLVMAVTNPSVRGVFFGGPAGLFCLAAGIGLNVVGRRWMKRITCSFD